MDGQYLSVGHLPCPTASPSLSVLPSEKPPGRAAINGSDGTLASGADGRMRESMAVSSQLQVIPWGSQAGCMVLHPPNLQADPQYLPRRPLLCHM